MKEYELVRKQLFEMLEDLDERLDSIRVEVQHIDEPLPQNSSEQNEQNEVLDYLDHSAHIEREMVKQAIARIDNGEYGICELCGDSISHERLQAIPHASMCIKCASQPGC
jgi:DnaK suppressor protein